MRLSTPSLLVLISATALSAQTAADFRVVTKGLPANTQGWGGVAFADVNADGFDDVVVSGHFIGFVHVYLSDGKGGFAESSSGLPNKTQGFLDGGHKLLLQDVTGDGKVELVFGVFDLGQGRGGGGIQVYKRTGSNAWSLQAGNGLPTSGNVLDIALADFDRDGNLDVVAGYYSGSGNLSLWRGTGNGGFRAWAPVGAPTGSPGGSIEGVAAGDIDGDTFPEIAYTVYGRGVTVLRNERTGFSLYGKACSGTLPSPPQLGSAGGTPKLGNGSFAWTLKGPASRLAMFCLGLSSRFYAGQLLLPLDLGPIGAPGCTLYTQPIFSSPHGLSGNGSASVPMAIPSLPVLFQYTVFGQGAVLVPGANALQLVFTEGGAVRVGR